MYPGMRLIHVFLDNARYHHAKLVQAWLMRPDWQIKLHFIPAYCPHRCKQASVRLRSHDGTD